VLVEPLTWPIEPCRKSNPLSKINTTPKQAYPAKLPAPNASVVKDGLIAILCVFRDPSYAKYAVERSKILLQKLVDPSSGQYFAPELYGL
jgi:hypothetical protein